MTHFDPDNWVTSLQRSLESYLATKLDPAVYEIVADYPDPDQLAKRMPLDKTLVHFAMEDPRQMIFGLGDNFVDDEEGGDGSIERWEARCHEVTYDIGVWASPESGGTTSRMEAREALDNLFNGSQAQAACLAATDGVDVRSLTGGRCVQETINELIVYRMVDIALVVRVFSRVRAAVVQTAEDIDYVPELTIDGDLTITG